MSSKEVMKQWQTDTNTWIFLTAHRVLACHSMFRFPSSAVASRVSSPLCMPLAVGNRLLSLACVVLAAALNPFSGFRVTSCFSFASFAALSASRCNTPTPTPTSP